MKSTKVIIGILFTFSILCTNGVVAQAQEVSRDEINTVKAKVLEVIKEETKQIPGLSITSIYQTIKVEILEGDHEGETKIVENDYLKLKVGEIFYLRHIVNDLDGVNAYSVADPYRMPTIYFFIGLFLLCVFIFGGKQGIRGLIALALSFIFILYLLFPAILHGISPVLASLGIASLIIILGSYITHGLNRVTSSAVIGMIATIIFTGILAWAAIHFGQLSGFSSEEAIYLNMDTNGTIDFTGLLLGGILIGLLGVLYDAAISQAVAVDELRNVGPHLPRFFIYKRAIRIGREHIGALVNTLAIAYVGASLPLLLLFYQSTAGVKFTLNQEIFATEIIRIMIGSIGLVLAVPITTLIAVAMIVKKGTGARVDLEQIKKETLLIEKVDGHGHGKH